MEPKFNSYDVPLIFDIYNSNLCYGLISAQSFPKICQFPLYVSAGELSVTLRSNPHKIVLTDDQLEDIKEFNYLLYNDVLGIMKKCLIFNKNPDGCVLFVVPFDKAQDVIRFDVIRENKKLVTKDQVLMSDEKMNLNSADFLEKIVIPNYRLDETVCDIST